MLAHIKNLTTYDKVKPAEMMANYLQLKPAKEMATRLLKKPQLRTMHAYRQSA